jgi:hypothetical protein
LLEALQTLELLQQACLAPKAAGALQRLGHCCWVMRLQAVRLPADPATAAAAAAPDFADWLLLLVAEAQQLLWALLTPALRLNPLATA